MIEKIKGWEERSPILFYSLLSLVLTGMLLLVSFTFASANIRTDLFFSYLKSFKLMLMNYLPILFLFLFFWLISNRYWFGYGMASFLVILGGMANRSKLTYRDDPLIVLDLTLIKEGMLMAQDYELPFTPRIVLQILILILIGWGLKKYLDIRIESKGRRLAGLGVLIILAFILGKTIYIDQDLYDSIGDESLINPFIEAEVFQTKGSLYPFIHSVRDLKTYPPEGYDEEEGKEILAAYDYSDIEGEKVHVIGVMLEAYNDFRKFEGLEIDPEVYKNFEELKKESLTGELVTNVFAGGTINTERAFLTGYHYHPAYKKPTNSYVWYLKEQGYRTEAMHPITGAFYNRISSNDYLGFDNFYYEENKFGEISDDYLRDWDFFDYIIEGYEESLKDGDPYFNFSVTFQNHGPYEDKKETDREYLKKQPGYRERDYNIINNYLSGIAETDKAIKKLVDYFGREEEPVVIVFFGDHNPWLGEDNSVYKMLDIDLDLAKEEGFRNYYNTPYMIWGNEEAKKLSKKGLEGEGPEIGPNNLMGLVFDQLGWEGNEFHKLRREMAEILPVQNNNFFLEKGSYVKEVSEETMEKLKKYRIAQYYYFNNFWDRMEESGD